MYNVLWFTLLANLYLLTVLSSGRIEGLDEIGSVTEEERIARGARDHGQHCEPHVRKGLWRKPAVPDAQHVGHGLEQCP